jgi:hypothetical protein
MNHRRLTRSAALGLALTALAVPTAAAQQDLRGQGMHDSAAGYVPPPPSSIAASADSGYQDLRSPDARDAARLAEGPAQDLRSPDARDAAEGRGSFNSPEVTVVKIPESSPGTSSGSGLDLGDAGIGAAGLLGLILIGLGGTLAVMHRRQRETGRPATTG